MSEKHPVNGALGGEVVATLAASDSLHGKYAPKQQSAVQAYVVSPSTIGTSLV